MTRSSLDWLDDVRFRFKGRRSVTHPGQRLTMEIIGLTLHDTTISRSESRRTFWPTRLACTRRVCPGRLPESNTSRGGSLRRVD
jgi:hypothetical protein